ncbi:MAG: pyridoxal phosphate-dependent aminotransferase [Oscillospiraceae bacterium]|nr:pyridoxal phosphate-dependent aminotransferase [Oscillospiraceae bacterium]MBR6561993.1 pyridoxal phosphate-dependent aminotransferase [Oscillospiraceae bacterium]
MKTLSRIAGTVRASTTLAVDSLAKQMKADGYDVVGFGTGEPDFDTPDNIKEAACAAIRDGQTKYTPAAGIIPLRQAIAARLKADCDLDYDYTQIVVASGAKHNVFLALIALLNPGDEVILPAPYWVSYYEMIRMAGGEPVIVTATEQQEFKITPEQLENAITEKTKVFMINNPSNPTGMLYSREELIALAEVCVKHDLYIISDEIYYSLVYGDNEFVSIATLSEDIKNRTILINGVSKSYAMTGWRIGYAAANPEIARVMSNYVSHSTGAPSTISQYAAIEALTGQQEGVDEMRRVFEERKDYIVSRINAIPEVSCIVPDGAFYVMMNIEKLIGKTLGGRVIQNDEDFAMAFLEKGLVAVVPCASFGAPNFLRWTYAASMESIRKGMDRLEKFLHDED